MTSPVLAVSSSYPPPSVVIATEPYPGSLPLPRHLSASWHVLVPGHRATLTIAGDVLTKTTLTALWTSAPRSITWSELAHRRAPVGWVESSWKVEEPPLLRQSTQQLLFRSVKPSGPWGPWVDSIPKDDDTPYVQNDPTYGPATTIGDFWYAGPPVKNWQEQYRLVLHLEPGTHIESQTLEISLS